MGADLLWPGGVTVPLLSSWRCNAWAWSPKVCIITWRLNVATVSAPAAPCVSHQPLQPLTLALLSPRPPPPGAKGHHDRGAIHTTCLHPPIAPADTSPGHPPLQVGTMIEVPRAALQAGSIAQTAEFFSFGTNDLTQMTFGYSRDDVGKFLPQYIEKGILQHDPFQVGGGGGVRGVPCVVQAWVCGAGLGVWWWPGTSSWQQTGAVLLPHVKLCQRR